MKNKFLTVCILSALILSSCSNADAGSTADESVNVISDSVTAVTVWETDKAVAETEPESESPTETETESSDEETEDTALSENDTETESTELETSDGETDTEIVNRIKAIDVSAYDSASFARKYVDEVYDIYIASEVAGSELEEEWVNNVFLAQTPEEQEELPLYQIIIGLNISEEDLRAKNEELSGHLTDEMITALYLDDINEMKKRLVNPWALYYDGEIYPFDDIQADPNIVAGVPAEVMNEYLDFIESIDEVRVRTN